jgi:hypothetical protein
MYCKGQQGLAPGAQTGLNAWAEEVKKTRFDALEERVPVKGFKIEPGVSDGDGPHARGSKEQALHGGEERAGSAGTIDPLILAGGDGGTGQTSHTSIPSGQAEHDNQKARELIAWVHGQRARESSTVSGRDPHPGIDNERGIAYE